MKKISMFLPKEGPIETVSCKRAHEIMGPDMIGVDYASKFFGVDFQAQGDIHCSESTLKLYNEEGMSTLVWVPPLKTIYDISKILDNKRRDLIYDSLKYSKHSFFNESAYSHSGWQLISKVPVHGSTNRTWEKQQVFISKKVEIPSAFAVIYTVIMTYILTGERLLGQISVRCSDTISDNRFGNLRRHIDVGHFDNKLHISDSGDQAYGFIGIILSRKLN